MRICKRVCMHTSLSRLRRRNAELQRRFGGREPASGLAPASRVFLPRLFGRPLGGMCACVYACVCMGTRFPRLLPRLFGRPLGGMCACTLGSTGPDSHVALMLTSPGPHRTCATHAHEPWAMRSLFGRRRACESRPHRRSPTASRRVTAAATAALACRRSGARASSVPTASSTAYCLGALGAWPRPARVVL